MASGVGAPLHSASTLAASSRRSAKRRRLCGTNSTHVPLRPARPVRPERCNSVAGLDGRLAWITSPRSGISIPRAATSVATHTRACPWRRLSMARLRSFCPRSPEIATEENPRSVKIACNCRTASRVWQNTIAVCDSIRRSTLTIVPAISPWSVKMAR